MVGEGRVGWGAVGSGGSGRFRWDVMSYVEVCWRLYRLFISILTHLNTLHLKSSPSCLSLFESYQLEGCYVDYVESYSMCRSSYYERLLEIVVRRDFGLLIFGSREGALCVLIGTERYDNPCVL